MIDDSILQSYLIQWVKKNKHLLAGAAQPDRLLKAKNGTVVFDSVFLKIDYQDKFLSGNFGSYCDSFLLAIRPLMEQIRDLYTLPMFQATWDFKHADRRYISKERYY